MRFHCSHLIKLLAGLFLPIRIVRIQKVKRVKKNHLKIILFCAHMAQCMYHAPSWLFAGPGTIPTNKYNKQQSFFFQHIIVFIYLFILQFNRVSKKLATKYWTWLVLNFLSYYHNRFPIFGSLQQRFMHFHFNMAD